MSLFDLQTEHSLSQLGKFFLWRRKPWIEAIKSDLNSAESIHQAMVANHSKLQEDFANCALQLQDEKTTSQRLDAERRDLSELLHYKEETITKLKANLSQLDSEYRSLLEIRNTLQEELRICGVRLREEQATTQKLTDAQKVLSGHLKKSREEVNSFKADFSQLDSEYRSLLEIRNTLQEELRICGVRLREEQATTQKLTDAQKVLSGHLKKSREEVNSFKADFSQLDSEYRSLLEIRNTLQEELRICGVRLREEQVTTQKLTNEQTVLNERLQSANNTLETLKIEFIKTDDDRQAWESKHNVIQDRHNLVSRLLSAQPDNNNPGLKNFKSMLYKDYLELAPSSISAANTMIQLQEIEKELELVVTFPEIHAKNTIAISGGFSSGKSEFVNSFMNKQSTTRLAVGINPVTAIPSYVVAATSTDTITGKTANGGRVPLEEATFKIMSHEYIKSFGFDLKQIMPFMSIGVSLDSKLFSEVCLIDTPGYDSPNTDGYTSGDRKTAISFIEQSKAVLWLIGLDANGTYPKSDLDFIRDIDMDGKALFVVVNKADLRPLSDTKDIVDEIEDALTDANISFVGISAYSSTKKKEFIWRRKSLSDFLRSRNKSVEIRENLLARIKEVFNLHRIALFEEIERRKSISSGLKSIQLDIMQHADPQLGDQLLQRMESIRKQLEVNSLENQLQDVKVLNERFNDAVKLTFENINLVQKEKPSRAIKTKTVSRSM